MGELKPLLCPYCGDSVLACTDYHLGRVEIECGNTSCRAEWNGLGEPVDGSHVAESWAMDREIREAEESTKGKESK